jgi:hypothetical protein
MNRFIAKSEGDWEDDGGARRAPPALFAHVVVRLQSAGKRSQDQAGARRASHVVVSRGKATTLTNCTARR